RDRPRCLECDRDLSRPRERVSERPTIQGHTACFNADGSMDITLQANPPTDSAQLCNWIPIPTTAADPSIPGGDFIVFLPLSRPNASVLQGQWIPPGIQSQGP